MNWMAAFKAGVLGVILAVGVAFLGYIPVIDDLIQQIGWAVGLVIGAMYVMFASAEDPKLTMREATLGGGAAGLITIGIQSVISTIYFGGMFERLLIGSLIGGAAGAILGAIGGATFLYLRHFLVRRRPKAASGAK